MSRFEKCPICGRKGWYIGSSDYDLEHRLRTCKYCHAFETDLIGKRMIVSATIIPTALPAPAPSGDEVVDTQGKTA